MSVANLYEYKDSKSFLSMMVLMIRCILYPKCKLFVTSGGKEQASGIMKEKVQEICNLIPAFEKEINWTRGVTLEGKDYARYVFKSGSYFDNIAARESSRGKRRHANEKIYDVTLGGLRKIYVKHFYILMYRKESVSLC